jgi:hypothetical protein
MQRVTANIYPGYNGAQNPLFVQLRFAQTKIKPEHFQIFLLYQEIDKNFLILKSKGIRRRTKDKINFDIFFNNHYTTVTSVFFIIFLNWTTVTSVLY